MAYIHKTMLPLSTDHLYWGFSRLLPSTIVWPCSPLRKTVYMEHFTIVFIVILQEVMRI